MTDESMMPFGKYGPDQGDHRKLADVPDSYLRWLYEDCELDWDEAYPELSVYIDENWKTIGD